ncbi:MAG: hypothetical protein IJF56_04530 [Clostridia bacterium]|nr:hypothetical protein [Clostridia bacterium]
MENNKEHPVAEQTEAEQNTPETSPAHPDEEHTHSNYRFALKVLGILLIIILIIVILQASGVSIAIKDWLMTAVRIFPHLPLFHP